MKVLLFVVACALACTHVGNAAYTSEILESVVNQKPLNMTQGWLELTALNIYENRVKPQYFISSYFFLVLRSMVGCMASVSGFLYNAFDVVTLIKDGNFEPEAYSRVAVEMFGWSHQNGPVLRYMCGEFYQLITS